MEVEVVVPEVKGTVVLTMSIEEAKDLAALVYDYPRAESEGRAKRGTFRNNRPWVYELESALVDADVPLHEVRR